jgi:hypothetical protein
MRWIRSRRAVFVTAILGLALVLPAGASAVFQEPPGKASSGMTITIKEVVLMDALTIDIHADVTCAVPGVWLDRVAGWVKTLGSTRQVVVGFAPSRYQGIVCDGKPNSIFVRVPVDAGGVAFKAGKGQVALEAGVSGDLVDTPPLPPYFWPEYQWAGASTGWVPVRIGQWPNSKPWPEPPFSPPLSPPSR